MIGRNAPAERVPPDKELRSSISGHGFNRSNRLRRSRRLHFHLRRPEQSFLHPSPKSDSSLDFCAQRNETLTQMLDQSGEHDQPETLDQPETFDQLPPSDGSPSGSMNRVAVWWPIIAASVIITCFSIAVSVAQMFRAYPRDPWESIIIADAYRYSVGLPVYTNPFTETGHATHMYGPLLIYAVGLIFKWKGINVAAAHLVPLAATIWTIAALAVIYFRGAATGRQDSWHSNC